MNSLRLDMMPSRQYLNILRSFITEREFILPITVSVIIDRATCVDQSTSTRMINKVEIANFSYLKRTIFKGGLCRVGKA